MSEFRRKIQESVPVRESPQSQTWAGWKNVAGGSKVLDSKTAKHTREQSSFENTQLAPTITPVRVNAKEEKTEHVRIMSGFSRVVTAGKAEDRAQSSARPDGTDDTKDPPEPSPRNVGGVMIYSEQATARVPLLFSSVHQDSGRL